MASKTCFHSIILGFKWDKSNFQFSLNDKKEVNGARDTWTDLPDNLIEVPPVSLQSLMLEMWKREKANTEGGREGEKDKETNSKGEVQKDKNNQHQILLDLPETINVHKQRDAGVISQIINSFKVKIFISFDTFIA